MSALAATTDKTERKFGLRVGKIPSPFELIPETPTGMIIASGMMISGAVIVNSFGVASLPSLAVGVLTAIVASVVRGVETRQERRGCVLGESDLVVYEEWERPEDSKPKSSDSGVFDEEMTEVVKDITGNKSLFVERHRSEQFAILAVRNRNPKKLGSEEAITAIAIEAGVDIEEVKFIPVWRRRLSAYLIPLPEDQWRGIKYTTEHLVPGDIVTFAGIDVSGSPVLISRKATAHGMYAGQTRSGKTVGIEVDIRSALDSDTRPIIHIIDPKNDLENFKDEIEATGGSYVNATAPEGIKAGIELLETLSANAMERKQRYPSGVRNIWQYRDEVSSESEDSRPVMVYADEMTVLLKGVKGENKTYTDDDGEVVIGWAARVAEVVGTILRRDGGLGLFFTGGMQRPDAKFFDGEAKGNTGFVVAFSHQNKVSSSVSIDATDAVSLPMPGGMVVRVAGSNKLRLGRGAYVG